jgi:hypothetical protein
MIDFDKLKQVSEPNEKWNYLVDEKLKVNKDFGISNFGRVYSTKRNKLVKQYTNKTTGYNYFFLNDFDRKNYETISTHRAVALSWLKRPTAMQDDYYVVDHVNEIKTDNRVCNLQWITQRENLLKGTVQERKVKELKKTVEVRNKMQEKDAMIIQLTKENQDFKNEIQSLKETDEAKEKLYKKLLAGYFSMKKDVERLKKENEELKEKLKTQLSNDDLKLYKYLILYFKMWNYN